MWDRLKRGIQVLGPGLVMAGAAVGVSHLVQATRAGASFGFELIPLVIMAHLLKYPFFAMGHLYPGSTGQNLLQGYKSLGVSHLLFFYILTLLTFIGSVAGVTFVTGALASHLFSGLLRSLPLGLSPTAFWSLVILGLCSGLLIKGRYPLLDRLMKWMMGFLFVGTLLTLAFALFRGPVFPKPVEPVYPYSLSHLPFLIALMGWMPAPLDMSVWQSVWVEAKTQQIKDQQGGSLGSWQHFDFNFGYAITLILAVVFLMLGALVMHGSQESFASSGGQFAGQLIHLYTSALGVWATPFIGAAALCTMFSTTLTLLDGYPRTLTIATDLVFDRPSSLSPSSFKKNYLGWLLVSVLGGALVILFFINHLKLLIDVVTISAFLAAPGFAYLNYQLAFSKKHPIPPLPLYYKYWSWLGLAYLIGFGCFYVFMKFVRNAG